jgi:2-keto-4-pentenoate hydratase/2-oxohepta-3-ene-1,7-dioic acid hydratase in catechol pathway
MGMNPPRWLKAGDVVRIAIAGLGEIENPIAAPRA